MNSNALATRRPSIVASILTFALAGPFIAGLVGTLFVAMLGGNPTARDETWLSPLKPVTFGVGWFRSVITEPAAWSLTVIPTLLAAVFFWALTHPKVPPRGGLTLAAGGIKGGLAATVAWVLSLGIRLDFVTALGSLLLIGWMIVPTGVILGMLLGWWFSGPRPNSTPHTDARTSSIKVDTST